MPEPVTVAESVLRELPTATSDEIAPGTAEGHISCDARLSTAEITAAEGSRARTGRRHTRTGSCASAAPTAAATANVRCTGSAHATAYLPRPPPSAKAAAHVRPTASMPTTSHLGRCWRCN